MMDGEAMQSSWFLGSCRTAEICGYTVHPDSLPTGHLHVCFVWPAELARVWTYKRISA